VTIRLALALLLVACSGPGVTIHTRTSPLQVEVTKQASVPELRVFARITATNDVELVAKQASHVRVTRVVHYGTASFHTVRGSPWGKLVEIPLGLIFMLEPAAWGTPNLVTDTTTTKLEVHTNWLLSMLNPLQSVVEAHFEVDTNARTDVFVEPPAVREFRVNLPAPGLEVAYRAIDEGGNAIVSGTVTTDAFGRVTLTGATRAIALEVTVAGTTTVIPIEVP
jgi:hypothetical protein